MLTNLTPCVYPMIPITLRLLGQKTKHPYLSASSYALGIMLTYTALGLVAAGSGQMFGQFMGLSWVNLVLTIVMALLGLSMLYSGGFTWLQNLGLKLGGGAPSLWRSALMGVGAGFVASPCTGPILAGLIAYSSTQGDLYRSVFLFISYSLGFSLPYVFLGGMAQKITQIKLSDKIQTTVKIFFAAVMFALSFYYLRIPLYPLLKTLNAPKLWLQAFLVLFGLGCLSLWLVSKKTSFQKRPSILLFLSLTLGSSFFLSCACLGTKRFFSIEAKAHVAFKGKSGFFKSRGRKTVLLIDFGLSGVRPVKKWITKHLAIKKLSKNLKKKLASFKT